MLGLMTDAIEALVNVIIAGKHIAEKTDNEPDRPPQNEQCDQSSKESECRHGISPGKRKSESGITALRWHKKNPHATGAWGLMI
jgi:hypothetical protein